MDECVLLRDRRLVEKNWNLEDLGVHSTFDGRLAERSSLPRPSPPPEPPIQLAKP